MLRKEFHFQSHVPSCGEICGITTLSIHPTQLSVLPMKMWVTTYLKTKFGRRNWRSSAPLFLYFLFLTVLLRYIIDTQQITYLKYTIWLVLTYVYRYKTITTINIVNISIALKCFLMPLGNPFLPHCHDFCHYKLALSLSRYFIQSKSYSM